MKNVKFSEVAVGDEFVFYGQIFRKVSVNSAVDAEHICHLFLAEIEVEIEIPELVVEADQQAD